MPYSWARASYTRVCSPAPFLRRAWANFHLDWLRDELLVARFELQIDFDLFADSERTSFSGAAVPERADLEEICKRLDIRVGLTALRGIENYFPDNAIKAELGPKYSALGPFGSPKNGWVKAHNWRIARHMTRSDLQGTDLGQFLEAL